MTDVCAISHDEFSQVNIGTPSAPSQEQSNISDFFVFNLIQITHYLNRLQNSPLAFYEQICFPFFLIPYPFLIQIPFVSQLA